jgi:hypothetical protein
LSTDDALRLGVAAYDVYSHTGNIEVDDRKQMEVWEQSGDILTLGCSFEYYWADHLRDDESDYDLPEDGYFKIKIDLGTREIVAARSGITKGKNPGGILLDERHALAYGAAGIPVPERKTAWTGR